MVQFVHGSWIRVGPAVEVLLRVRGDGAELGFLPASRHDELVVVEKRRIPFPLGPALLAVAEKLIDRLGNRVLDLGRFALDHHHWQAVEEQHDVGDDVVLGAEDADLELADRDEAVVVAGRKVREADGRALLAALTVLADACVLQQELEQVLVVLQQTGAREARGELLDDLLDLIVFEPGVDDLEPLAQHRRHHDLGEALPMGVGRGLLHVRQVDDLPAQARKLVEQRLLDVVALVEAKLLGCGRFRAHGRLPLYLPSIGCDPKSSGRSSSLSRHLNVSVTSPVVFRVVQ